MLTMLTFWPLIGHKNNRSDGIVALAECLGLLYSKPAIIICISCEDSLADMHPASNDMWQYMSPFQYP